MTNTGTSSAIVICTLNRPDDIRRCVAAVCAQTRLPAELVVIDAGDLRDVRHDLERECRSAGIRFVYQQAQPSTTQQRNQGAGLVEADVTFFLDDDVVIAPDYIARIVAEYESGDAADVAGVCGCAEPSPEPGSGFWHWYARLFLLADTRADVSSRMKASNYPVHATRLSAPRDCDLMPSTAVSYRTDVFRQFLFDTHLTGYVMAEDLDLSFRVSRVHRLRMLPDALYRHSKSDVSRNDRAETERRRLLFTQYFFRKNMAGNPLAWVARYWALLGLGIRYAYVSLRSGDRQWLRGYLAGVRAAARNHLLWPGRFEPGPLRH